MKPDKRKIIALLIASGAAVILLVWGCAGSTGDVNSPDPIMRGCSYIAAAIVTNAIIRAIFH